MSILYCFILFKDIALWFVPWYWLYEAMDSGDFDKMNWAEKAMLIAFEVAKFVPIVK